MPNDMLKIVKDQPPQNQKGQGTPEQIEEAEEKMTPEQAATTEKHKKDYEQILAEHKRIMGKLSPEDTELAADCNLTLRGGVFGPFVIEGTIRGQKVKIKGNREAKIDGQRVPEDAAGALFDKYFLIAHSQTEAKKFTNKTDAERTNVEAIRDKIKKLLS